MILLWKIRYLDTRDKQFKDRDLWLDTNSLDVATKATVELICKLKDRSQERKISQYRHFFKEKDDTSGNMIDVYNYDNSMDSVFIHDYFEDENGNELSNKQMASILTGKSDAIMFWAGTKQHHIDYAFADKRPISIDQISLADKQLEVLGYFSRDLREMLASAFYKNGPAKLTRRGSNLPDVETSVTDEEIRSFVTIFRRLYIQKEPANFLKAAAVFEDAVKGYPINDWIRGVANEYEAGLRKKPFFVPYLQQKNYPFSRKRVIDVFLYTQYAHQPNAKRKRQFEECLLAAGNIQPLLTWLFLTELHACSLHIRNAGVIIADFYDRYCQCHRIFPDILQSMASNHPGIGMLEKKEAQQARIFQEKVEELAKTLWENNGCPEGDMEWFIDQAQNMLEQAFEGECQN